MNPTLSKPGWRMLDGAARTFLAELLVVPSGLITVGVLTRRLGADGYGLFTLTAAAVAWVEWTITTMFARATYKCVSEAADWRPVGAVVLRLHLAVSVVCALLVMALAGPLATLWGEPALAGYLRWLALDIPFFSLTAAHRAILIGAGRFRERAWLGAGRWITRAALVALLVGLGLSIPGAIAAFIGTSVVELALARRFIRPSLFGPGGFPVRRLWETALPLFLCAASLRLFEKLDLFMLKWLGASAALAGLYGAAQNLTVVVGIFASSFSPLLLSTLTLLLRDGHPEHARMMGRDAMRLVTLLLPLAGLCAGAAGEVVRLIAGPKFAGAGPLLSVLIFEALVGTLMSVANGILIAAGKARWTFAVAGPMVPLAALAHWWVIPRYGPLGAACVTTAVTILGAAASLVAAWRLWRIGLPVSSLARSLLLCAGAAAFAVAWPTPGAWVVVKLAAGALLILIAYLTLGEFSRREIMLAWSLVPGMKPSPVDDKRYWEKVGTEWRQSQPDKLWRVHSDVVNRAWLESCWPQRKVERVLKTDMFDEAVGEGVFGLLRSRARLAVGMDIALTTRPGVVADVRRLPFADSAFDLIVSNSTLDHFQTEEELVASLRELRRVLRPGGELLLTLDNAANPIVAVRNILPFALLHRLGLTPYQVGVTCGPWKLRRWLRGTGFDVAGMGALLHCPRVLAVKQARAVEQSGNVTRRERFLKRLMRWERLARWPTRWLTGYFVAVKAVRKP
ncbi:MAG: methyltransferase domain-containing protein [Verrucomicrobiae bacterium]|nr:methyltransferase domain-containing protein [Verrucomicrobiae bacterium]